MTSYNVVGEIPGTDKKDEVIMLGGHLDSWHSATGATDNAIGCATMMEAARILKADRRQTASNDPRRVLERRRRGPARLSGVCQAALWNVREPKAGLGEIQRLLQHRLAERAVHAGYQYFRPARGGDRACARLSRRLRISDLQGVTAQKPQPRRNGPTSFNAGGPCRASALSQDPIEYFNVTWHTNLDTYERIIEPDVKASAIIFAAAVYTLAMRDEMLPEISRRRHARTAAASGSTSPTPTPRP